MNLVSLAHRNLALRPQNFLVLVTGMGAVCTALILWSGFATGFRTLIYRAATHLLLGEAQIHQAAYAVSESIYDTVDFDDAHERALADAHFKVAPRLYSYALAAQGSLSRGIKVVGIDPKRERQVSDIHRHLASGNFFDTGTGPSVVVGSDLAEALQLTIGGDIVVFGQAADGGLASGVFRIAGILLPVNDAVDQRHVYMNTADFRNLFLIERGVHELVLRGIDGDDSIGRKVELEKVRKVYPGTLVQDWRELRPGLSGILDLLGLTLYGTLLFVYFALGSIVLNVQLMQVLARQREYGIMQAVGMARRQVIILTVLESMLCALAATLLAVVIGVPIGFYLEQHGLDVSHVVRRIAFSEMMLEPVLYGKLGPWQVICPVLFLWVTAPLAALYPAIVASSVDPAVAIATGGSRR